MPAVLTLAPYVTLTSVPSATSRAVSSLSLQALFTTKDLQIAKGSNMSIIGGSKRCQAVWVVKRGHKNYSYKPPTVDSESILCSKSLLIQWNVLEWAAWWLVSKRLTVQLMHFALKLSDKHNYSKSCRQIRKFYYKASSGFQLLIWATAWLSSCSYSADDNCFWCVG